MTSKAAELTAKLESLTTDQPMTPAREGRAPKPALPLKRHQVEAYEEELRRLGDLSAGGPRDLEGNRWKENMGGDRALASKRAREIRKILNDQAPKKISGPRANEVYAVAKQMRDEVFKPALLPAATEHRAPSGTVGHLQRTVFTPMWNRAAVAFKRAIRALDPENPDPDLANIDRFRPKHDSPGGAATFDVDAVIPGNFAFGGAAKANWEASGLGEPTVDTPLKQAQRREATIDTTGRAERAKANLAKARAARAAKLAQRAGAGDTPTDRAKD